MSADGRYVVFGPLFPSASSAPPSGIYLRDLVKATTVRVDVTSTGSAPNASAELSAISANGRYVTFDSFASNLVTGFAPPNAFSPQVYVRDMVMGTTKPVSVTLTGGAPADSSQAPISVSNAGQVVFTSGSSNLVSNDHSSTVEVFVRGPWSPYPTVRVSTSTTMFVNETGVDPNGASSGGDITVDGRYVVFESTASNLVSGYPYAAGSAQSVYVRDLARNTTQLLANDPSGSSTGLGPSITPDGRHVVFTTGARLVSDDNNGVLDVYELDLLSGATTRISVSSSGRDPNNDSFNNAVSDDGRYVAFESYAANILADGQGSGVFLRDLLTGTTTRVGEGGDDNLTLPSLSADGRYVLRARQFFGSPTLGRQRCSVYNVRPAVEFSIGDVTAPNGSVSPTGNPVFVPITLSQPLPYAVSVKYTTLGAKAHAGTAVEDTDFVPTTAYVQFPAGVTTVQTEVRLRAGVISPFGSKYLSVQLSDPSSGVAMLGGTGKLTILQEGIAMNQAKIGDVAVPEGDSIGAQLSSDSYNVVRVPVVLERPQSTPFSVQYRTVDGTATAPADYTAATGTVVIQPGATTVQIPLTIRRDKVQEGDEQFTVQLTSTTGGYIDRVGTVTIRDDD